MFNVLFAAINLLRLPFGDAIAPSCTLPGAAKNPFFGFPHWWEYLKGVQDPLGLCVPKFNFPGDILAVALAVIDILLRLAGIVAVIAIIIAGITYITSAGSSEKATAARNRIQNALIGLVIVILAAAVVSFIGKSLA